MTLFGLIVCFITYILNVKVLAVFCNEDQLAQYAELSVQDIKKEIQVKWSSSELRNANDIFLPSVLESSYNNSQFMQQRKGARLTNNEEVRLDNNCNPSVHGGI